MFIYQKNKKVMLVVYILIYIFSQSLLFAEDNTFRVEFKCTKLLEYGKKEEFKNVNITLVELDKVLLKNENNPYPFYTDFNKTDAGKTVKMEIKNKKNWVIISPYDGKLVIPNAYKQIKILVVRKYTDIYFEFFSKYEYSVQVISLKNDKKGAYTKVDELKRNDEKFYHEGIDVYCDAIPIIPNRGYFYKVKVGRYSTLEEARLRLSKIKSRYPNLNDSFITARLKVTP